MRVARRTVVASALAAIAAPALLRRARADAPVTLKLHHFMSSVSSGHDKFLAPWARKIEADSGGRIQIDIFPSMQLGGTPAQLFDQARDGLADIVWAMPSLTPGRFPRIEMFELPLLPSRRALVSSRALDDFAAVNLKDEFAEVHPLSFSCSDRGVLHAGQPVRTIDDLKDLKLHVQTRFAGEAMRVLGAHPVPMPFAQLPMAISQHVVDACVDPWHLVPTLRLNDLLKAHTEFSDYSLSSTTYVLAMNKPTYERLPRELKAVIDGNSGAAAAGLAGAMWDLQARAVVDTVMGRGDAIVTLLPEAVAHWRKATEPVVEIWLKEMKEQKVDGGKLIAGARALLGKYASLPEPEPAQIAPPEQNAATDSAARGGANTNTAPTGSTSTGPSGSNPTNGSSSGAATKPNPIQPEAAKLAPAKPDAAAVKATATAAPPQPPAAAAKPAAAPAAAKPASSAASMPPTPPAPAPIRPAPVATPAPAAPPAAAGPAPAPATVAGPAAPPPLAKPAAKTLDIPL